MKTQNNYYEILVDLTKSLDFNTQMDLINSYKQSISDLNLEMGTFDQITKKLGSPEQFCSEFKLEMDHDVLKSIVIPNDLADIIRSSFKWLLVIQVLVFTLLPLFGFISITLKSMFLHLIYILLAIGFTYIMTSILLMIEVNIVNFYFNSFKIMIVILFANLVFEVYRDILDHVLFFQSELFSLSDPGAFLLIQLPVAIVSGLELKIIFSKISIEDVKQSAAENSQLKMIGNIKKIVYIISFILVYIFVNLGVLIGVVFIITSVLIFEGFYNEMIGNKIFTRILKEIIIVNYLYVMLWFLLDKLIKWWQSQFLY
jgi:uncharacterized membrane protein